MSGEAKVLTGLLQRRALEQAFAELGSITDPAAVQQQAQTIAEYGASALQYLLTLLDTPDPQLRGGLGQVARHLPHGQITSALRAVARDRERSDQTRLAAVTLLERFLDEPVDDAFLGSLGSPDTAARQSLTELIAAMDVEPLSVLEYLEQLGEQPPEVVNAVLDALPAVGPSPHLATFLRMLAQGEDARIARRAVDELIRMRTPAAARALASLVPNLPPTLAPLVERGLRKLRFSGVQEVVGHDPAQEPWYAPQLHWRALVSPVDAAGAQFIWFVGSEKAGVGDAHGRAVFFTVLIQEPIGLRDASGSLQAAVDHAPPMRREGALHFIVGDGAISGMTLLEAPFEVARAGLREALALNWATGEPTPIGYRLFSPLIWLVEGAASSDGEIAELTPAAALTEDELVSALGHPAFYGWFDDVDGESLTPVLAASYARRFRAMSRWFATSGDGKTARMAASIAYHLDQGMPQASSVLSAASQARAGHKRRE